MGGHDSGRTRATSTILRVALWPSRGAHLTNSVPACKQEGGVIYPLVDLKRCEGKGDCERVCPESVFEVRRIDEEDYRQLGLLNRLKVRVHGFKGAEQPNAGGGQAG